MSVVDLHPEDLLDKRACGALTDAERARLEAHVATCAACRFELMARDDFADLAEPRSATPVSRPPEFPPQVAPLPAARGSSPSRRRALVFGVAAALIGGMSFAALSAGLIGPRQTSPSKAAAAAHVNARASVAHAEPPADAPPGAQPSQQGDIARTAVEPASASMRVEKEHAPSRGRSTPTASELFRAANGARRSHDTDRAITLYRELESRYPQSEEARVSYATVATLLLDHGDPRAALDGFDRYLSQGGSALGEEAAVGRALSYQKLGATSSELAAWQEVLRRFPGSVHAPMARARLAALGQR